MSADPAGLLRREVSTLMFDQYGTIVDMQGGLTGMVAPFLAGKGWRGDLVVEDFAALARALLE